MSGLMSGIFQVWPNNCRVHCEKLSAKCIVTHKEKSLDVDVFYCENSVCLFDLMLYVPVDSYCHVEMLAVVRDVKQ